MTPRTNNTPVHVTDNESRAARDSPPAKLLLVDDQAANLTALAALLESEGHSLVTASNGTQALRLLLNDDFAAILLDVEMPGMDGFETAALVKQRERTRYIPILFITAAGSDERFVGQAYAAGAVDFIRKPVDPAVLRSKVSVFVDLYRQREQIRQQAEQLRESERRELSLRQEMRERERERRHLAELAVREAQLREFKVTLDATLDGVLLFEPESLRFLYANQGAQHLTGYSSEDLLGMTPPGILDDCDRSRFRSLLRPLRHGDRPSRTFESCVRRKDGTVIPVEAFLQYVPEAGDGGRFVFLVRDISERHRAEAERAALQREVDRMAGRQRAFLREVLAGLTEGRLRLCYSPEELPTPLAEFAEPITLVVPRLRTLRRQVEAAAEATGLPLERYQDLETAVGEAAMNAVVHGRDAEGRVCVDTATGTVQVWVRDRGAGISEDALHRATLERGYSSAGTLGHGFWIMLKTCDRVYLLTGAGGTTVVLEQGRAEPLPGWMQELRPAAGAADPVIAGHESLAKH